MQASKKRDANQASQKQTDGWLKHRWWHGEPILQGRSSKRLPGALQSHGKEGLGLYVRQVERVGQALALQEGRLQSRRLMSSQQGRSGKLPPHPVLSARGDPAPAEDSGFIKTLAGQLASRTGGGPQPQKTRGRFAERVKHGKLSCPKKRLRPKIQAGSGSSGLRLKAPSTLQANLHHVKGPEVPRA